MAAPRLTSILALAIGVIFAVHVTEARRNMQDDPLLTRIAARIGARQYEDDVPFSLLSWATVRGEFQNELRINYHGNQYMTALRRNVAVPDGNSFTTMWVIIPMLEACKYGGICGLSDGQISEGVESIENYVDKNVPYDSSSIVFWPQAYNPYTNRWDTRSENLLQLGMLLGRFPPEFIPTILSVTGLEDLAGSNIFTYLAKYNISVFKPIPSDFDDIFCNIAMGSVLKSIQAEKPSLLDQWLSFNTNLTSATDWLEYYVYRPFSDDPSLNTVEGRTYFYMREFLDDAYEHGEDIALPVTWLINLNETSMFFAAPLNVAEVDAVVCANTINGVTSAILSGLMDPHVLDSPALAQVYENTTSLIAFMAHTRLADRPDLALQAYPHQMIFHWFLTRTVTIMETAKLKGPLPHPLLEKAYDTLKSAAEEGTTDFILSEATKDEDEGTYYFDDFLGNADFDEDGNPVNYAEDRIFITATAVNALLSTWVLHDEDSNTNTWKPNTPDDVKEVSAGAVEWLTEHALDKNYKPWNAIFSGVWKEHTSYPHLFPANVFEYFDGTPVTVNYLPREPYFRGIRGYIPKDEYENMLLEDHFGEGPTPVTFYGQNNGTDYGIIWTSEAVTYSSVFLAIARYDNIDN